MADDRPANDDLTAVVAEMKRELADLRSTALARMSRKPTGDIEPTIRTTPKPDTLLLQGQTVNRADYPALWQWVQDQDLIRSGLFASGNGTTTFVIPDLQDRMPIGASASLVLGALGGASTTTLSVANLPSHNHGGSTSSDSHSHSGSTSSDSHSHSGSTGSDNPSHRHGVHGHTVVGGVAFNPGGGTAPSNPTSSETGNATGGHSHGFSTSSDSHGHNFNTSSDQHSHSVGSQGSGQGFENRPPYLALNWLLWT